MTASEFARAYEQKWIDFGLVPNDSLRNSWEVLATAFENCIAYNRPFSDEPKKRLVVPIPTGSGKTTGLELYLNHLNEDLTALVVVYFTEVADKLEQSLNEYIANKAIAIHSKNGKTIADIGSHQVLIVTHEHFKTRLFSEHLNRDLIVIDEAIDLIREISIKKEVLNKLNIVISRFLSLNSELEDELEIIKGFHSLIDFYNDQILHMHNLCIEQGIENPEINKTEFLISDSQIISDITFLKTREIIRHHSCSEILSSSRISMDSENKLKQELLKALDSIENFFGQWYYYYGSSPNNASLNTAVLELPQKSVVILDATAQTNHLYRLFQNVHIYPINVNSRNYENVTLYVANGINVGRGSLLRDKESSAKDLMDNLTNLPLSPDSKMLIVTHKNLKAYIQKYRLDCNYETAHFGNLTGKNDWKDYDIIVIFGLMYKPKPFTLNRHALAVNPESAIDSNLTTDKQIRKKIEWTDLASEVIQAINRVRCRNTVDTVGNCKNTQVYMALPNDEYGVEIQSEIIRCMPNIQQCEWAFFTEGLRRTSRKKSSYHDPVLTYIVDNIDGYGEYLETDIIKSELAIPPSSFNELIRKESFLNALHEKNISKISHPRHGQKSVFVKDS